MGEEIVKGREREWKGEGEEGKGVERARQMERWKVRNEWGRKGLMMEKATRGK